MFLRLFDLDGSIARQKKLLSCYRPVRHDLQAWGRRLRRSCGWGTFSDFELALSDCCQGEEGAGPMVTLLGSGDFHHLSLALLRRLRRPCNLLVLDRYPSWERGLPFLHQGNWLYHAARLPQVQQVFHVGGDQNGDGLRRWLAPWPLLTSGKIAFYPARQRFHKGRWKRLPHLPLRVTPNQPATPPRLRSLLAPFLNQLPQWPLYVSLDKNVLGEVADNLDGGPLTWEEIDTILTTFRELSDDRLAGMDIVGDWSRGPRPGLGGIWRHLWQQSSLAQEREANRLDQAANQRLLDLLPLGEKDLPLHRQRPPSRFTLKG